MFQDPFSALDPADDGWGESLSAVLVQNAIGTGAATRRAGVLDMMRMVGLGAKRSSTGCRGSARAGSCSAR